eukprot:2432375-Pyramimonas_sp.AAC.1
MRLVSRLARLPKPDGDHRLLASLDHPTRAGPLSPRRRWRLGGGAACPGVLVWGAGNGRGFF